MVPVTAAARRWLVSQLSQEEEWHSCSRISAVSYLLCSRLCQWQAMSHKQILDASYTQLRELTPFTLPCGSGAM